MLHLDWFCWLAETAPTRKYLRLTRLTRFQIKLKSHKKNQAGGLHDAAHGTRKITKPPSKEIANWIFFFFFFVCCKFFHCVDFFFLFFSFYIMTTKFAQRGNFINSGLCLLSTYIQMWSLPSYADPTFRNRSRCRCPVQTLHWWFLVPRVAETTSCISCETSNFASWEPSLPDTAPSCPPCSRTRRTMFPLRDVERNRLYPNVEVEFVENVAESQLAVAASRVWVARNHLEMVDDNRQLPSFGIVLDDPFEVAMGPAAQRPTVAELKLHLFQMISWRSTCLSR